MLDVFGAITVIVSMVGFVGIIDLFIEKREGGGQRRLKIKQLEEVNRKMSETVFKQFSFIHIESFLSDILCCFSSLFSNTIELIIFSCLVNRK